MPKQFRSRDNKENWDKFDMNTSDQGFSSRVAQELPYLRRYSRALTGSQDRGDKYTVATLEAILKDRTDVEDSSSIKVGVFKCFHAIWTSTGQQLVDEEGGLRARAQGLLAKLTMNSREALLLRTIEEFRPAEIAEIMELPEEDVQGLIKTANSELARKITGNVMIIEDEMIIAGDLTDIVEDLGHTVTAIARTRAEAVEMGKGAQVDLILADIQLADNSSGIDAVNDLLAAMDVPVIFITAFPERLLTGDKPEPAFLISKPFKPVQVQSAVSQAMFFASTATLRS